MTEKPYIRVQNVIASTMEPNQKRQQNRVNKQLRKRGIAVASKSMVKIPPQCPSCARINKT